MQFLPWGGIFDENRRVKGADALFLNRNRVRGNVQAQQKAATRGLWFLVHSTDVRRISFWRCEPGLKTTPQTIGERPPLPVKRRIYSWSRNGKDTLQTSIRKMLGCES